jgi:hypothetical protein
MKSLAIRVCADFVIWFKVQHQGPLTVTVVLSDSSNHLMYCNVVHILAAHPADCTGLNKRLPVRLPSQTCNSAICIVTTAMQKGFSCTCLKKRMHKEPCISYTFHLKWVFSEGCKVVKQTSVRATDMIQLCIGLGVVSACTQHWALFHTLSVLSLSVAWAPLLLKIWRKVENITFLAPRTENNFGCGTLHAEVSWTFPTIQQCFFSKWTENTTLH